MGMQAILSLWWLRYRAGLYWWDCRWQVWGFIDRCFTWISRWTRCWLQWRYRNMAFWWESAWHNTWYIWWYIAMVVIVSLYCRLECWGIIRWTWDWRQRRYSTRLKGWESAWHSTWSYGQTPTRYKRWFISTIIRMLCWRKYRWLVLGFVARWLTCISKVAHRYGRRRSRVFVSGSKWRLLLSQYHITCSILMCCKKEHSPLFASPQNFDRLPLCQI